MTKLLRIATALLTGCFSLSILHAASETELKDSSGKVIIRYVVEPPATVYFRNSSTACEIGSILASI
jgi:hypothetical protein